MKLQTALILIPLTLIVLLGTMAMAIDDGGSGKSADELIDQSRDTGTIKSSDPRFPPTPWVSRALQNNTTASIGPMPSSLSGSGNSPQAARAQSELNDASQNAKETEASSSEPTTSVVQAPVEVAPVEVAPVATTTPSAYPTVAGSWSMTLTDSLSRNVILTLFQKDDNIYGTGSMRTGNDSFQIAASGIVSSGRMFLDIVSLGSIGLYRADMDLTGDSANGSYSAFGVGSEAWTGSITGIRTIPQ